MTASRFGGHCLFSAPFHFIPGIEAAYQAVVSTTFREIWLREDAVGDPTVTAWVMNPGQKFVIDDAVLDRFPNLRVLVTPSTGRNHIDQTAADRRDIAVHGLLDDREATQSITASAEFTFLLLMTVLRRPDIGMREVTARRWRAREDEMRGHELHGKTVGLVGLGRIGGHMAQWCEAFGAHVVYHDPYVHDALRPPRALADLFATCDIVCICCTLTSETRGMIGSALVERMKPGACLINTSRGEVLDEPGVVDALRRRSDLKVGLDVIAGEVTGQHLHSPLLELHDRGAIVVTPHIAGAAVEAQSKAARIALSLLERHLASAQQTSRAGSDHRLHA